MTVHRLAHAAGAVGMSLVFLLLVGLAIPPAEKFPDSLVSAFHTFFVGTLIHQEGLPAESDPGWMAKAEPGDVLFFSRGHVAWGEWSHVAMVVRAPDDAVWVKPGTLAVFDASIYDGMYLSPLEAYGDYPRVVVRRASDDPEVRRRMAEAALTHRTRIFVGVARNGAPYTNCTTSVISALQSVGIQPHLPGWRTPDELLRSEIWLD